MNEHQIIRRFIEGPVGPVHIIECTCGRQISMTNSLKIAERKAAYHLEVAKSDDDLDAAYPEAAFRPR